MSFPSLRWSALPIVALALLVIPSEARGICAVSGGGYPQSGDVHPMRARVYLFVSKGERRPVYEAEDSQGRPLSITWRALPQALNHDVYRLEFRPLLPGSATLFWRDGRGERSPMMSVVVSERWKAPDEPVRILEQEFNFFDGCPRTHTRDLVVSIIASAYRVTFASSREDYLAGRTRSLIIPGEAHSDERGIRTGRGLVRLGHLTCFGDSFSWAEGPVFLGVTALLADGTETPLPAEPTRVEPPPTPEREYY